MGLKGIYPGSNRKAIQRFHGCLGPYILVGLRSLDVSISSQCAAAIDNMAAFYFKVWSRVSHIQVVHT